MERARIVAAGVSLALIGATLWPLAREPYGDSFPLSTYPMFASKGPTTLTMSYSLGEGRAGERITLAPILVGTGEVLQAIRVIERAVRGGRAEQARLCTAIAARVAADPDYAAIAAVRLVSGTHDAVEYLVRDTIGRETEHSRCVVPR